MMKIIKRTAAVLTSIVIAATAFTGCESRFPGISAAGTPASVSAFKLNTIVNIKIYDSAGSYSEDVINNTLALCDRYEQVCSRTLPDSELSQLNRGEISTVSPELGELLEYGLDYSRLSDGAFDISIGAVSSLWDFSSGNASVPDESSIHTALPHVGYEQISIQKNSDGTYDVTKPSETIIDLGAVAKGFIADKIKDYLTASGIKSAIIDLGGNILCIGNRPDSASFIIGVKNPDTSSSSALAYLSISDRSVVSSGTYERTFTVDGTTYHHILDPATGYPYDNNLWQVTIISDKSVTGDCLSTTCFSLGLTKGLELIEKTSGVEAIFVTRDGSLHYSSGAKSFLYKK